jgi:5-methylcytosine-specific restriction endonuclease McrA
MTHGTDAVCCEDCGVDLPPRVQRGRPRKWCKTCSSNHYGRRSGPRPTHCLACSRELPSDNPKRKWCSLACAHRKRYLLSIATWCPPKPPREPKSYRLKVHKWKPAKRPPMRTWTAGYCAECATPFVTNQPQTRFCCVTCKTRNKDRIHTQRRDKRIKAGPRERIDLPVLAIRDGWRCHLCKRKVTRKTWSVDHLVPLSHGGTHTYDNVALAHHRCNALRRDGGTVQLRLAA